jgi:hypothetical protein
MMKIFKIVGGLALAAMLTACGGGGGSAGTTFPDDGSSTGSNTTTAVVTPTSIEVLASANEVLSAGAEVVITAVVKNANNVGMAEQPVVFSVNGSATLQGAASSTNDDGVATARLSAGANKALRNVTVTVSSGTATGSITLPVSGTRMTLTGAASLKLGDATSYIARLVDSSGNGIGGATINVSSANGNGLSSTVLTTSANGEASFIYTANVSGTDTLSITGLGTSAQAVVNISSLEFAVLTPANNTSVIVGANQTISVQYKDGGVGQPGVNVLFSTTRGTLSAASVTTDGSGIATVTVSSSSSGPANVVAQISGVGQVTLPLQFVATTPASLVLQANPGAVLPNTSGGTTNQSTLEAVVLDASGNAVANRQVNFTILEDDGNGGTLSTPTALTDANGRAQVQFVSGAQSTRTNGVVLQASVAGTGIAGTTALTVNGQALFISIGFGNTISNKNQTTYSKEFSVYVTDASGNAVGNQVVTLSNIPTVYGRGVLGWSGTVWTYSSYTECQNEDLNQNGVLDTSPVAEDTNNDGELTPGNPVVITPGSVTTDSQGRATFALEYGEQYVPWLTVKIVARASVGGTESRRTLVHELTPLASDFSSETIPPAGRRSPFGITQSCTAP